MPGIPLLPVHQNIHGIPDLRPVEFSDQMNDIRLLFLAVYIRIPHGRILISGVCSTAATSTHFLKSGYGAGRFLPLSGNVVPAQPGDSSEDQDDYARYGAAVHRFGVWDECTKSTDYGHNGRNCNKENLFLFTLEKRADDRAQPYIPRKQKTDP